MIQGIFLADGPSDLPLARHLERICADLGVDVTLTAVDPRWLSPPDRTVESRLQLLLRQRIPLDIVFVHRDAEGQPAAQRRDEVRRGAAAAGVACPLVPVVPVRMTEAWLLLDEGAIRRVAGRPSGRVPLGLPTPAEAERLANPKAKLDEVLLVASETTGRRRRKDFANAFGRHRALLLERLDLDGPVTLLAAWQHLLADTAAALKSIGGPS